jgi:putative ABC transport system substrate-binding protein
MKWPTLIWLGIVTACCSVSAGADTGSQSSVMVVMSRDSMPYQELLTGFKEHLVSQGIKADYSVIYLDGGASLPLDNPAWEDGSPALYLVLGSRATDLVINQVHDVPIIEALAVDVARLEETDNATGILMEHSVAVQLEYLKRILPDVERLGVLFNPSENSQRVDQAQSVAQSMKLELIRGRVETPRDLPGVLRMVSSSAQVIWGIVDHTVLVAETAKHILVYSFRNRIPLTGLSDSWVKAGALYSLERDYEDVGAQCAEQAIKIFNGAAPGSLKLASPRKVTYALNLKTASHMKLNLSPDIIAGAERIYE